MDYADFDVALASTGRRYELHVSCPGGEDKASVQWQGPTRDLGGIFDGFRDVNGSDASALEELKTMGRELFTLLFPHEVATLWHRCLGRAEERGCGVRLRIHVDLRRKDLAWFGGLPWELLYDEDSGGFLALDGRTPVVRYLDMRQSRRQLDVARPLRVLVLMPEPYGAPRLDLEAEREHLQERWEHDGRVELVFPETNTFDGARQAISPGPIHAVHFMGHGDFDEKTGQGGLVFEARSGRSEPVQSESLGRLISGVMSPPTFAILNGCETGRTAGEISRWPFAGAAEALMRAGLSASVAMQLPIGDREAIDFSRVLYRSLQQGHPVEGAVAEARLFLSHEYGASAWANPALFMRVSDGRLFATEVEVHDDAERISDLVTLKAAGVTVKGGPANFIGRESRSGVTTIRGDRVTEVEVREVDVEGGPLNVIGERRSGG